MTEPTAREEEELKKAKIHDKKEQLCNISQALAVLASASVWSRHFLCYFSNPVFWEKKFVNISPTFSYLAILQSVTKERQEFLNLVNKEVWFGVPQNIHALSVLHKLMLDHTHMKYR